MLSQKLNPPIAISKTNSVERLYWAGVFFGFVFFLFGFWVFGVLVGGWVFFVFAASSMRSDVELQGN